MLVSDDGRCFAFEKREMAVLTSMMASEEREGLAALWFQGSRAAAWATDGHRALMVEREIKPPKAKPGDKPVAMPAATAHHATRSTTGPPRARSPGWPEPHRRPRQDVAVTQLPCWQSPKRG